MTSASTVGGFIVQQVAAGIRLLRLISLIVFMGA